MDLRGAPVGRLSAMTSAPPPAPPHPRRPPPPRPAGLAAPAAASRPAGPPPAAPQPHRQDPRRRQRRPGRVQRHRRAALAGRLRGPGPRRRHRRSSSTCCCGCSCRPARPAYPAPRRQPAGSGAARRPAVAGAGHHHRRPADRASARSALITSFTGWDLGPRRLPRRRALLVVGARASSPRPSPAAGTARGRAHRARRRPVPGA